MNEQVPEVPWGPGGAAGGPAAFATTRWSLVLAAGGAGAGAADQGEAARRALGELYEAYWYPLYAHVRRQGHGPEAARDFVQDLFARFLENDQLAHVSRERGRFRSYLLASVNHLLAGDWQRRMRQKRGGGAAHVALDALTAEERYRVEPADGRSPEALFDRRWAAALLERVFDGLRKEWEVAGKGEVFRALRPYLSGEAADGYAEVGRVLGMSEGAARVTVHRLRAQYRERLRAEVGQTLADPADIDGELRHLLMALRGAGGEA